MDTKELSACSSIAHLTSVKGQATRTGDGKKGAKSEVRQSFLYMQKGQRGALSNGSGA